MVLSIHFWLFHYNLVLFNFYGIVRFSSNIFVRLITLFLDLGFEGGGMRIAWIVVIYSGSSVGLETSN